MMTSKRSFAFLLTAFSLLVSAASLHAEQTLLWKLTADKADPVYLLGSIHVGVKSFYPLPPQIEKAFAESKNLVVEVDITAVNERMEYAGWDFADAAFYPSGDTLQKHISKDTYRLLMKEIERYGVDTYRVQRLRPWAISMALSGLELAKSDADSALGIDIYFLKRAPMLRKTIMELESPELQAKIFDGLPDAEQEAYLISTLKTLTSEVENLSSLMNAWRSGDVVKIEKFIAQEGTNTVLHRKMISDRNKGMLKGVEDLLKQPGTDFVVVGAAHLIGPEGLIRQLLLKGYKITQL